MTPINRDKLIKAIAKWDRYGVDDRGRLVEWHHGSEAYVKLEDVLDTIARMPEVDIPARWVPVTERLPEENGDYLVSDRSEVYISYYLSYGFNSVVNGDVGGPGFAKKSDNSSGWVHFDEWDNIWMDETDCIKAWMPVTEPYRKEEEE